MTTPLQIAIIGSGIAGLSAAWLLGRHHAVTLYERHARPGMGAFNLDTRGDGTPVRIDMPLRVFKGGYYDTLMALYRAAGVRMQATDHAAAWSTPDGDTYYRYRNVLLGGRSIPLMTGLSRRSLSMTREVLRFMIAGARDRARGGARNQTLGTYLERNGYSQRFVDGMLLPSFASICTCSYDAVRNYPAEVIIDFFSSGSLLSGTWRARHGADDAITRLLSACQALRCDTQVRQLQVSDDGVRVTTDADTTRFDHVIIASQANQASALTASADAQAAAWLARVPYESSEVVVHADPLLIPSAAQTSPVHFHVDDSAAAPMASIHLNHIIPELEGRDALYQTWNPLIEPRTETVLGRAQFERPLVTLDSQDAMTSLRQSQRNDARRLWFCGSYVMPGIPLLESAAQSAVAVAGRLGVAAPWATT